MILDDDYLDANGTTTASNVLVCVPVEVRTDVPGVIAEMIFHAVVEVIWGSGDDPAFDFYIIWAETNACLPIAVSEKHIPSAHLEKITDAAYKAAIGERFLSIGDYKRFKDLQLLLFGSPAEKKIKQIIDNPDNKEIENGEHIWLKPSPPSNATDVTGDLFIATFQILKANQ